jgi:hypothetical protein
MVRYTPIDWNGEKLEVETVVSVHCDIPDCEAHPAYSVELRDARWMQVCLRHRPLIIEE